MAGENKPPRERVGFIGLGTMGSRMARRIWEAGYPLTVYNRTRAKTEPLARLGASVASTPRELAAECQVVISSLEDDAAVEEAMLGPEGAVEGARQGTLFIDTSTVFPGTSRRVAQAAGQRGASMIDAAVSGTTVLVEQGALTIFVGGEEKDYQRGKPYLEILGKEIFHMGPSGMGTSMKLVVNTLLGLGLQAIAEAIALGEKSGLQRDQLLEVLGKTIMISPGHKPKLENAKRNDYPVTFALRLMYKDLGLILRQAAAHSVPMPATAVAQQIFAVERARNAEEDYSVVIRLMEELAGIRPT